MIQMHPRLSQHSGPMSREAYLEGLQREAVRNGGALVWGEGGEEGHAGQALIVSLPLLHAAHHYDGAEGAALHAPHHPRTLSLRADHHSLIRAAHMGDRQIDRQAGR